MNDDWITTMEAADIGGYNPVHLRRLLQAGKITARKFGPTWQVSHESLLAYLITVGELGAKRGPKRED